MMQHRKIHDDKGSYWLDKYYPYVAIILSIALIIGGIIDESWLYCLFGALLIYFLIDDHKTDRKLKKYDDDIEQKRTEFLESLKAPDFIGLVGYGKSFVFYINCRQDDVHRFEEIISKDELSQNMLEGRILITKQISSSKRSQIVKLARSGIPFYGHIDKHIYEHGKVVTTFYYCYASNNGKYMQHIVLPFRNNYPAVQIRHDEIINSIKTEKARQFISFFSEARKAL